MKTALLTLIARPSRFCYKPLLQFDGFVGVEKLERRSDVAYAVVLLTPDDEGRAKGATTTLAPRARQNVILELGYFAAKLGRRGVCALYTHGVELPSDWNGVEWVEMDGAGGWRFKLGRELKHAGFDVDLNVLA